MRILFDSQQLIYKDPFGTLAQEQNCTLHIHIPSTVGAVKAECILDFEDGKPGTVATLQKEDTIGAYDIFGGSFVLNTPGLYFYYFRIYKPNGAF